MLKWSEVAENVQNLSIVKFELSATYGFFNVFLKQDRSFTAEKCFFCQAAIEVLSHAISCIQIKFPVNFEDNLWIDHSYFRYVINAIPFFLQSTCNFIFLICSLFLSVILLMKRQDSIDKT